MHVLKRPLAMLLVLVAASMFVVACGDDEDSNGGDNGDTAAETESDDAMEDDSMEDDSMEREPVEVGGVEMSPDKNIVENASAAPNLTTVVSAVTAADLVETLSGPGPFTVFAPDDAAFEKVDQQLLQRLLQPAQKQQLTGILTYHVVAGELDAASLEDGQELETVNGETLMVKIEGDSVMVGNEENGYATVTTADVFQSNGVVHVIDTVMLPPTPAAPATQDAPAGAEG